jgi:outer membrane protein
MRLRSAFAALVAFVPLLPLTLAVAAPLALLAGTRDAHATEANVVYVDLDRAVADCEEGRQAEASLVLERNKKQPEISGREAKLKKMEEDLRRQIKSGNQAAVETLGVQMQAAFAEYQQLTGAYQRELNELEHKLYDPIEKRVKELLRAVLLRDGYDMVMSARGVAFARRDLDITQKIITEYNQKFPVAAAGSSSAKPSAAPSVAPPAASAGPAASVVAPK